MEFSFIPSSKGKDLLATDGFMFAQKARLADGSIRRERTLRRSKNCPCTAHTDAARAEVTTKGARNHPGDVAKVTAAAARVAMAGGRKMAAEGQPELSLKQCRQSRKMLKRRWGTSTA